MVLLLWHAMSFLHLMSVDSTYVEKAKKNGVWIDLGLKLGYIYVGMDMLSI